MDPNNQSGRSEIERQLLKALYDALKGGEDGGLLKPALTHLKDRSDHIDGLSDEEVCQAARKLHRDGIVTAEEAFRPRKTFNPTISLTPKGWQVLEDMEHELPDEWTDAYHEILKLLYEQEREGWNQASPRPWVYRSGIMEEIDSDSAVIDRLLDHMLDIGFVMREREKTSRNRPAYMITEEGAQAHENHSKEFEIRGFE